MKEEIATAEVSTQNRRLETRRVGGVNNDVESGSGRTRFGVGRCR